MQRSGPRAPLVGLRDDGCGVLVPLRQPRLEQLHAPGRQLDPSLRRLLRRRAQEAVEVAMRPRADAAGHAADEVGEWRLAGLLASGPKSIPVAGGEIDGKPQGPLDRHLPVAEGGVVEDPALLALLEGEEGVADAGDVVLAELAVLLAEVLAERPVPPGGVDELHLARRCSGLRLVSTHT